MVVLTILYLELGLTKTQFDTIFDSLLDVQEVHTYVFCNFANVNTNYIEIKNYLLDASIINTALDDQFCNRTEMLTVSDTCAEKEEDMSADRATNIGLMQNAARTFPLLLRAPAYPPIYK